jgi:DNA-binding MarR family transcriptional regulator
MAPAQPQLQSPDDTSDPAASLELLSAVEERADLSQRGLAQRMGIALGLTNAYLRRAVNKGLIKVRQAPARRYFYYLTPQGFSEKARLTREFLSDSFGFFRRARSECDELLRLAAAHGHRRVLVIGASELAEIATLAARDHDIDLVGVVQPGRNAPRFAGVAVMRSIADAPHFDAVLIADIATPQETYDRVVQQVAAERIMCPKMLRVSAARAAAVA